MECILYIRSFYLRNPHGGPAWLYDFEYCSTSFLNRRSPCKLRAAVKDDFSSSLVSSIHSDASILVKKLRSEDVD